VLSGKREERSKFKGDAKTARKPTDPIAGKKLEFRSEPARKECWKGNQERGKVIFRLKREEGENH